MTRYRKKTQSPFDQASRQTSTQSGYRLTGFATRDQFGMSPDRHSHLEQLMHKPVDFMDSKELHQPDAQHQLFDLAVEVPEPDISWYDPVMSELGMQGDSGRNRNRKRGEVMRLTGKQERALFYQYNYARYRARHIQDELGVSEDHPPLRQPTAEQAEELLYWARLSAQLREQIAETNVGLVLAMVRRTSLKNVDVADLVSEGNMALLRAIDKFNPDYGFKFSTYACQSILKAFSRLAHKESRLHERFPMEYDPDMEESEWSNLRRDNFEQDCAEAVAEIVRENRCNLTDVELRVVRHRFGLDFLGEEQSRQHRDDTPNRRMTLGEVGQMIGVGKERVRQIQVKALTKIRHELETGFLTGRTDRQREIEELLAQQKN